MPLLTYEDARPWARAIKASVVAARMPPGQVVGGFGSVRNAPALSPFEVGVIAAWADGGSPKGGPGVQTGARREGGPGLQTRPRRAELDATTTSDPTALRRPDVLLRLRTRDIEPAGQRVTMSSEWAAFGARAWISGWRFFPNDPAIVQAEFRLADGRYLGSWTPPEMAVALPDDVGLHAVDGAVTVDVTYRRAQLQQDFPVGRPRHPPVLGLFTTRRPPARRFATMSLGCDDAPVGVTGDLLSVRARASRDGASVAVATASPDVSPTPVVAVRDLAPNRAPVYWLRQPITMASETRLLVDADAPGCRIEIGVAIR